MNFKKFCIIGIKVVAVVAAGAAVWLGLSKGGSTPKKIDSNNGVSNENASGCLVEKTEPTQGQQVVNGLKKFQDTAGKIFSVAQSLAVVGENLYRIFNGGYTNQYYSQPGNFGCHQGGFTRVTANIIEAGYNPAGTSAWGPQSRYNF